MAPSNTDLMKKPSGVPGHKGHEFNSEHQFSSSGPKEIDNQASQLPRRPSAKRLPSAKRQGSAKRKQELEKQRAQAQQLAQ